MKKAIFLGVFLTLVVPFTSFAALDVNLKYGSHGDSVTELQEFLTDQKVYTGPITGNFYSLTLSAVKTFQLRESISPVSGFWGPLSRTHAQAMLDLTASNDDEEKATGTVSSPVIQTPVYVPQVVTTPVVETPAPVIPVPDTYEILAYVNVTNLPASVKDIKDKNTLYVWHNQNEKGAVTQNGSIFLKVLKNGIPVNLGGYVLETTSTIPGDEKKTFVIPTNQTITENYIDGGIQKTRTYTLITGLPNGSAKMQAPFGEYTVTFSIPALNIIKTIPLVVELAPEGAF